MPSQSRAASASQKRSTTCLLLFASLTSPPRALVATGHRRGRMLPRAAPPEPLGTRASFTDCSQRRRRGPGYPSPPTELLALRRDHMPKPTVVLVHGAWADGSSWNAVSVELQQQGFT